MNDEDTVQTRRFGQNCAAQSSQMTSDISHKQTRYISENFGVGFRCII